MDKNYNYISIGKGKLYHGDMLELFPKIALNDKRVVVLSDPPYNIGMKYDNYNDNLSEIEYKKFFGLFAGYRSVLIQYPEETIKYIVSVLGIPDKILVWCYNSNISKQYRLISIYNTLPDLNKSKVPYKNPKDKRIKELIARGSKGTRCYDWFSDIQIVKNISKEKTNHPCQIPIKLMQRLIVCCTNKEDIIIDPFLGVGSVAIACESLGRKWIGIELSKKYCNLAETRIKNYEQYIDKKFIDTLIND